MKWRVVASLGLAVVVAAGAASAQSLTEMAEQEKKRREALKDEEKTEVPSFSDRDLEEEQPADDAAPEVKRAPARGERTGGGESEGSSSARRPRTAEEEEIYRRSMEHERRGIEASQRSEEPAAEEPVEAPASAESGEAVWRARSDELKGAVRKAEEEFDEIYAVHRAQVRGPLTPPRPNDDNRGMDPNQQLTKDPGASEIDADLQEARTALEEARQELAAFQRLARSKGVPPGWIR